jgi:hypothetical protein
MDNQLIVLCRRCLCTQSLYCALLFQGHCKLLYMQCMTVQRWLHSSQPTFYTISAISTLHVDNQLIVLCRRWWPWLLCLCTQSLYCALLFQGHCNLLCMHAWLCKGDCIHHNQPFTSVPFQLCTWTTKWTRHGRRKQICSGGPPTRIFQDHTHLGHTPYLNQGELVGLLPPGPATPFLRSCMLAQLGFCKLVVQKRN